MDGFGRREFQLVLLRRMGDFQPDLVLEAARRLGASRTEMREVNARWQRFVRARSAPRGVARLRAVLGPPEEVAERPLGDVHCRASRWTLPLWPEFRYEALAGPEGTLLQEWLVRPESSPIPDLTSVADLAPWSCVVGDVAQAFAPVTHLDGEGPSRWAVTFTTPEGTAHTAHFTWGLLQSVT
ncbi:hypothetical protein LO762_14995 [Actinocorallia sp. API 0066]|uniref:hypothetical protein n=1 Tax=Actinocorallia sp. API 0066 TaxID=2896846 RepID=UPI001E46B14F|nr:hypothetical protein [Actinocorallia sp. API 0066]MCD0450486.1 hypothetical protein [Actinocorallia sp. API 0066]